MCVIRLSLSLVLVACCISGTPIMRTIDLGRGYILGEDTMVYNDAISFCDLAGKTLISIETMEEDILLNSLLPYSFELNGLGIWTSGKNHGGDADHLDWRWGTGEPLYYSRWQVGQPGTDGDYCLYLRREADARVWNSNDCTLTYLALCEDKAVN